jgi:tRNA modification GTPase
MSYGSVIAAISTPPGKGGVALIRVSGEGAIELCSKLFFPRSGKPLTEIPPRMQIYGDIMHSGEIIDDGMATVFRAPASYTGEDTVEITCHGGMLITAKVLEATILAGAIPAGPGEFTERAFINGKLTLSDAEAIGNLLEARSYEQIRLASQKSRNILSEATEDIRKSLTELLASVFARIDYPDEDLGDFTNEETLERLNEIKGKISRLEKTYSTARAINEGISTVIVGKPNVGKSSLYNAILGEEAAIVTDIEGTTRDVLSATVPLGRVMLKLSDTAGLRNKEKADAIEKIGIERTARELVKAELIIAVFDGSRELDGEDTALLSLLSDYNGIPKIAVINKTDLSARLDENALVGFDETVYVSAKKSQDGAKEEISKTVNRLFTDERLRVGEDAIVLSARQNAALIRSLEYVDAAIDAITHGVLTDAAASEIELALGSISELDGRAVAEEVIGEIFSKFCVGK